MFGVLPDGRNEKFEHRSRRIAPTYRITTQHDLPMGRVSFDLRQQNWSSRSCPLKWRWESGLPVRDDVVLGRQLRPEPARCCSLSLGAKFARCGPQRNRGAESSVQITLAKRSLERHERGLACAMARRQVPHSPLVVQAGSDSFDLFVLGHRQMKSARY